MEIDFVYLWVDGNDPKWRAKHDAFVGKTTVGAEVNCPGRYANHDELKYSLRSIEQYAPWIRKIFIVTDDQTPEWLDTSNPRIQIVDHKEIMPPQSLPCFNATVIEHFIPNIPGLSEHFLFSNDDMFLGHAVSPETFFAADGFPIIRLYRRRFRKLTLFYREHILKKKLGNYPQVIRNAAALIEKKYGVYFGSKAHHNIDAYLKSSYIHTREMFKSALEPTFTNHIRANNDIQRHLYSYAALAEKRAHVQYVKLNTSLRVQIHQPKHFQKLESYNPTFFCLNDSQYAQESDRLNAIEYIEKRFPNKSQFEK